jgi:hypothetical protein
MSWSYSFSSSSSVFSTAEYEDEDASEDDFEVSKLFPLRFRWRNRIKVLDPPYTMDTSI